jgi:hypothetical protein
MPICWQELRLGLDARRLNTGFLSQNAEEIKIHISVLLEPMTPLADDQSLDPSMAKPPFLESAYAGRTTRCADGWLKIASRRRRTTVLSQLSAAR